MDDFNLVRPPGCSWWPDDGEWPTEEEASHPLLDLSNGANSRKLARAIACQNEIRDAACLCGELSYAYQDERYNVACVKEALVGLFREDLEAVLEALAEVSADGKNDVARILTSAVQEVIDKHG